MKKRIILGCAFLAASTFSSFAQTDSTQVVFEATEEVAMEDVFEMSLEDLLNMEISVGGSNKMTLRETPGIITVITEKEIQASGARDLLDILRTVPGFDFSGDIENTIGLGVRGNFGFEGKVLLLIDGQSMNETNYGTVVFGNHYFTDNIQKIEIIRGPGSAFYGGMAELAVINIITKTGEEIDGGYASSTYGISNGAQSRVNGQFGVGKKLDNGLNLSLTGNYSEANRSNESIDYATNYFDDEEGAPTTHNYADSSLVKNIELNLGLKYKGLSLKTIYNDHNIQYNYTSADQVKFGGLYIGSKYEWNVNDKLTITPEVTWKKMNPWSYAGNVTGGSIDYLATNYRSNERITAHYKANEHIKITLGTEFYQDKSVKPSDTLEFNNGESSVQYSNMSAFGEVLLSNKIANFIVGARYDKHNQFGDAFVPRFAVTKVINDLHFKGLLSRAFKAPVIYNFELNPDIKPEFTTVAEIEVGYKINENTVVTTNAFWTEITDPIIYYFDGETSEDFYFNYDKASTIGAELELKQNHDWGFVNTSYSFYKNNNSKAEAYLNELNSNVLNAFPAHKLTITSGINITKKLLVAPTLIINSAKYGYYYQEEYWEGYSAAKYDATYILNLAIHYNLMENLKVSFGAYDIFNQKFTTVSAYDSGYYGTPIMGREFTIKAKYSF